MIGPVRRASPAFGGGFEPPRRTSVPARPRSRGDARPTKSCANCHRIPATPCAGA